jgi:class 3 adenylate cyclase
MNPAASQEPAPSGVVTFLFTDIEGSTRRWEADPEVLRVALAAHDDVLRRAIEAQGRLVVQAHGGRGVRRVQLTKVGGGRCGRRPGAAAAAGCANAARRVSRAGRGTAHGLSATAHCERRIQVRGICDPQRPA